MVSDQFEWDDAKAKFNEDKYGVTFEVAEDIFDDPLNITIRDRSHSEVEDRYVILGETMFSEVLVVTYAERGDRLRIISARRATRKTTLYEERL